MYEGNGKTVFYDTITKSQRHKVPDWHEQALIRGNRFEWPAGQIDPQRQKEQLCPCVQHGLNQARLQGFEPQTTVKTQI